MILSADQPEQKNLFWMKRSNEKVLASHLPEITSAGIGTLVNGYPPPENPGWITRRQVAEASSGRSLHLSG
jgi:hypothetical protein